MARSSRCPREGKRVSFAATPAALMLYQGSNYAPPNPGEEGTVVSIPVGGRSSTCLPGPGGGMVYVDWDKRGIVGVFKSHLGSAAKRRR
jgi:hypothetical protein